MNTELYCVTAVIKNGLFNSFIINFYNVCEISYFLFLRNNWVAFSTPSLGLASGVINSSLVASRPELRLHTEL